MTGYMDVEGSEKALQAMFPGKALDYAALHKQFGSVRLIVPRDRDRKTSTWTPQFKMGHGILVPSDEAGLQSATVRIARFVWSYRDEDHPERDLVFVSSDPELIPLAEALRLLGFKITFVCTNVSQVMKKGFDALWLHQFAYDPMTRP